jgi:gamma-glutamyltranspeptidase/glutathione hydrolase
MAVVTGRSKVATKYGIVAASQPLAAAAGAQILERGGHAVDAAIAANAVMGLVEPHMNGPGGDLFALVYEARRDLLHGLNAAGWAPLGASAGNLKARGFGAMPPLGIHTVTVPGACAGWQKLHEKFGRLAMADVLAPAIFYAERGFPVSTIVADTWAALTEKLAAEPEAARTYLPGGRTPCAGEVFVNRDLARSLREIATGGGRAGRGFYQGRIADAILTLSRAMGGTMTAADLSEFDAEWVEPISTTYHGWTVFELPPQTQGVAALVMLNLMEGFPLQDYGFQDVRALHTMIEAKKLAYADMLRYVGDPKFAPAPLGELLSKSHGARRARLIDITAAATCAEPSTFDGLTSSRGNDTIYLCSIDREGNIVSLIQSIYDGFGSGLVARGTGFALHNRGALFTLDETHPNALAPRKRPLHTIIPAFMRKDDIRIGFGIMGGFNQAQAHAQFVANIADYGLDIQEALEAGRFTKPTFTGLDVFVEALVPEATQLGLRALGHDVIVVPPRSGVFGYGQAVMSDGAGVHFGASEPRHDGAAIPEGPPAFERPTPARSRSKTRRRVRQRQRPRSRRR